MNRKILFVEDNPTIRFLAENYLSNHGFCVLVAENGKKALSILEKEGVRVIITDIQMPGMDGFELCRTIRRLHPGAWIAALTGDDGCRDADASIEVRFDRFFQKPLDLKVMLEAVRSCFNAENAGERGEALP